MNKSLVIDNLKKIASKVLPANSTLLLYGSRARGDNRSDSDWDLLILLDKSKLTSQDYDYAYPFREYGWDMQEYHELEAREAELSELLRVAQVLDKSAITMDTVAIGTRVRVYDVEFDELQQRLEPTRRIIEDIERLVKSN